VLPEAFGALLACLPAYPGSILMVTALNQMLWPHLPADVRLCLEGKKLRIRVRDARLTFDFIGTQKRFSASHPHVHADLTIGANVHDFVRLARREEDPDTLFFNRRLSMEGDTELGLVVKNTIDALELPVLNPQHWMPDKVMALLLSKLTAGKNDQVSGS
jgi:predicted lipid carrier protein YhbT